MGRKPVKRKRKLERTSEFNSTPLQWDPARFESDEFFKYYKMQKLVPDDEWEALFNTLMKDLPSTFWLSNMNGRGRALQHVLDTDMFGLKQLEKDGLVVEGRPFIAPRRMEWFSMKGASGAMVDEQKEDSRVFPTGWYCSVPKKKFKKCEALKPFHLWLMEENRIGGIMRQEGVSMIPPLLLDVQPHHSVLDMCAAPGSKTAQLIEMLHTPFNSKSTAERPTGFVCANDDNSGRAYLLVHQIKRLNSPNFLALNEKAQFLRNVFSADDLLVDYKNPVTEPSSSSSSSESKAAEAPAAAGRIPRKKERQLFYDRILADVPCSGDGTIRKSAKLHWEKWQPQRGNGLHALQLQIATRGGQLLKKGGLMVYSTCSFNPVENEASVAALLRKFDGALELVDVSDKLPHLKRRQGLTTWKIMDHDREWYGSHASLPRDKKKRLPRSMFPPSKAELDSGFFPLERCIRMVPHDQDTGGFFVAVLRKREEPVKMPEFMEDEPEVEAEPEDANPESAEASATSATNGAPPSTLAAKTASLSPVPSAASKSDDDDSCSSPAEKKARIEEDVDPTDIPMTKVTGEDEVQQPIKPAPHRRRKREKEGPPGPRPEHEPYVLVKAPILELLARFFGLPSRFFEDNVVVTRSATDVHDPRELYIVPRMLASLLLGVARDQVGIKDDNQKLTIVQAGIKLFSLVRSEKFKPACLYRLPNHGLFFLKAYLKNQIARIPPNALLTLLNSKEKKIFINDISHEVSEEEPFVKEIEEQTESGSMVLTLDPSDFESDGLSALNAGLEPLLVAAWKSPRTLLHMVSKEDHPWFVKHVEAYCNVVQKLKSARGGGASEGAKVEEIDPTDTPVAMTDDCNL